MPEETSFLMEPLNVTEDKKSINLKITDDHHRYSKVSNKLNDSEPQEDDASETSTDELNVPAVLPNLEKPAKILLLYNIQDKPPWHLSILLGLQHFLLFFGGIVSLPLLLQKPLCISPKDPGTPFIISTMFFVSGFNTLLQTTFGVRLPIVQGGTFAFLGPSLSILALPQWQCPNQTTIEGMSYDDRQELWQSRMRELQGSIIIASIFEVFIGFTGIIGLLMRFIGPLTIVPTICLTGLSLFGVASFWASKHWGIAVLVIVLVIFFSQYAPNFRYPCLSPVWRRRIASTFQMFPVLLSVSISWLFCWVLTATDTLTSNPEGYGYTARTDTKLDLLSQTPWLRFPYPFQWGAPTFSFAWIGLLSAVVAGIIESIGDYHACARLADAPPPPVHAVNRGIGVEGIGCIIAGIFGTGNGTTSYAENIAALGLTKVGSRRIIFCASVTMLLIGVFSKFGGLMAMMPDPIVGGLYCGIFGMISAVGLSQLQFVDLNSSRNLFVLGFAIFMGITVPEWVKLNRDVFSDLTGLPQLDHTIEVLLSTNMFVGGFFACILDNTIPGTLEERGIVSHRHLTSAQEAAKSRSIYDLPFGLTRVLNRPQFSQWLPFLPTYNDAIQFSICSDPLLTPNSRDIDLGSDLEGEMDKAAVLISSEVDKLQLYGRVEECDQCAFALLSDITATTGTKLSLKTIYRTFFEVRRQSESVCKFDHYLREGSSYTLNISVNEGNRIDCKWSVQEESPDANFPLYILGSILVTIILAWSIGTWLWDKHQSKNLRDCQFVVPSPTSSGDTSGTSTESSTLTAPPVRRLRSLDTFRGSTLLLMIFVNAGAGGYWFLEHIPWNGVLMADLLFPWFMFIMGVAICIAMRSSTRKGLPKPLLMKHIVRRTFLLFFFGLVINSMGYKSMNELRIPSVLGRFSIAYFVVATCELFLSVPSTQTQGVFPNLTSRWRVVSDILPFWLIWIVALMFPLAHVLLSFYLPVPGCPTGYVGPGGIHMNAAFFNCTGGAAGYIDRVVLGEKHIYQFPTSKEVYHSVTAYDPEGMLGYLNSVFIVFLGLQAGRILTVFTSDKARLIRLTIWSVVLGLLAGVLCGFSKNDGFIPVNKNLWSVSFVLTSASLGMAILAVLYLVIDVWKVWSGTPFHYPSVNSIVLYVGSELFDGLFPFSWHMPDTHAGQLFMATWSTALWLLISVWMYWRKISISL
ncbi:hypothetical protein RvY_17843 [Ramazzottius varieornatus]|uniref:Uncharacterized protein n=1 Tax=Ramazzottius varieornatus TaxID=947166 RepID=A0A1D1W3M1_RAMVA|nr:hypothetical protein RvY_17843 [Ramazzottius varieornatus]